jgi:DNA ligase-associated metallophosphoesterase
MAASERNGYHRPATTAYVPETDVLTPDGLVRLNGAAVRFDSAGVLHWPEAGLVAVADLHLEKGSSQGRRGAFVPPYDTRATLAALERVLSRLKPRRVVALGDSFHDAGGEGRMDPDDAGRLEAMVRATDWFWVSGNHDPDPPAGLGGTAADVVAVGGLVFRHEPAGREPGEVAGHLHPAAKVGVRGRSIRRRAFACDGSRCVLPAFGAYTGGLNVLDRAYRGLFERGRLVAWMIGEDRLYPVRARALLPD